MRIALIVILFFSIVGCESKGERYVIEVKRKVNYSYGVPETKIDTTEVYAKSDSAAFAEGANQYAIADAVYSKPGTNHLIEVVNFKVYNNEGKDISSNLSEQTKKNIIAERDKEVKQLYSSLTSNSDSLSEGAKSPILETLTDTVGVYKAPVKVVSAKLVTQEYSNYKDVSLTYKNVSGKKIAAIRFRWYGKTAFGDPADMGNPIIEGYGGGFDDRGLRPGKTATGQWNILSRNAKKIVVAWPDEVAFEDGSKWNLKEQ